MKIDRRIDMDAPHEHRKVVLGRMKFAIETALSGLDIETETNISEWIDFTADNIRIEVRGFVWEEQLERRETSYPADWWQAFKERWFPEWAQRRWPIKYTHYIVDIKALYPDLHPSIPDREYRIRTIERYEV